MALLELRTITVSGSRTAMGQAYGQACAGAVQAFVAQRARAANIYLRERGLRNPQLISELARQCLEALHLWDQPSWAEHQATAQGAGVDAVALYAAANYTDIRDILAYPAQPSAAAAGGAAPAGANTPDAEGCTAMLFPGQGAQPLIAAQTWDLNPSDLEYVVALHRIPDQGPSTWSITCAGCPSLIGMNERGLSIGTTNIKIRPSRVGIPYLSLIHAALGCEHRAQASERITSAPRAAAHTYWLADAQGAEDLECSATTVTRRSAVQGLARTNHCLDGAHAQSEGEVPSSSSRTRLARAVAAVAGPQPSIPALKALLADRSDGIDSINRYAEDGQGTSTNACVISVPARRELQVCRGSSDRGRWLTLDFTGAT